MSSLTTLTKFRCKRCTTIFMLSIELLPICCIYLRSNLPSAPGPKVNISAKPSGHLADSVLRRASSTSWQRSYARSSSHSSEGSDSTDSSTANVEVDVSRYQRRLMQLSQGAHAFASALALANDDDNDDDDIAHNERRRASDESEHPWLRVQRTNAMQTLARHDQLEAAVTSLLPSEDDSDDVDGDDNAASSHDADSLARLMAQSSRFAIHRRITEDDEHESSDDGEEDSRPGDSL
jgi:hypothetical protein